MRVIDADLLKEVFNRNVVSANVWNDIIDNQPTVNQWIPCSDRLPKDYAPVLTCDCKGNIHVMYHIDFYKKPFNIDRHNKKYYMVKAWQPLPAPYKGEE